MVHEPIWELEIDANHALSMSFIQKGNRLRRVGSIQKALCSGQAALNY